MELKNYVALDVETAKLRLKRVLKKIRKSKK